MPLLIPALGGALVVAGIIGVILGARRTPATDPAPRRPVQSRLGSPRVPAWIAAPRSSSSPA
jgi:tight adherence protein B